jgi:hypothetical protein
VSLSSPECELKLCDILYVYSKNKLLTCTCAETFLQCKVNKSSYTVEERIAPVSKYAKIYSSVCTNYAL